MRIHPRRSIRTLVLILSLTYISFSYAHHPEQSEHGDVFMSSTYNDHQHNSIYYSSSRSYYYPEDRETPWPLMGHSTTVIYLADHGRRRFEDLTPEEQERIRKRREAFRALPREEQERIHRARERFRQMPPEKREELRDKWKKMSPEEREKAFMKKHNHLPPKP